LSFLGVFFRPEACYGVATKHLKKNNEDFGRSGKLILSWLSRRSLVFLIALVCIILLIAFFGIGNWLTSSVCYEAHRVAPFRGPFSSVCRRIFLGDLFLNGTTGYAI
jgi:hypothetical protein